MITTITDCTPGENSGVENMYAGSRKFEYMEQKKILQIFVSAIFQSNRFHSQKNMLLWPWLCRMSPFFLRFPVRKPQTHQPLLLNSWTALLEKHRVLVLVILNNWVSLSTSLTLQQRRVRKFIGWNEYWIPDSPINPGLTTWAGATPKTQSFHQATRSLCSYGVWNIFPLSNLSSVFRFCSHKSMLDEFRCIWPPNTHNIKNSVPTPSIADRKTSNLETGFGGR